MVGDIEIGNDVAERGSIEGKKEGSENASEKLLPTLTFCLRF